MTIKAIETHYKGCRFRSRLEARWAVFFDAINVKWEYEKEGFEFIDGSRYLPDFWLPDLKIWIEIKAQKCTKEEIQKADNLSCLGDPVMVFSGNFRDLQGIRVYRAGYDNMRDKYILLHYFVVYVLEARFAIDEALSARFEFGEEG